MSDTVALILARGLGRRMQEAGPSEAALTPAQAAAASAGLKGLIPMAAQGGRSRLFLDYVISGLADAGFEEVALVVAPDHEAVRAHYDGPRAPARLTLRYVVQDEARGTADAVLAAASYVGSRPFVVLNADNLYPAATLAAMRTLDGPGLPGFERDDLVRSSGIPPERIAAFALLRVAPDGHLLEILEKPGPAAVAAAGPHALISMNLWRFDAGIFAACRDVPRSARGEFELPEAVELAIRRGAVFRVVPAQGPVLDLSRQSDIGRVADQLAHLTVRL